MALHLELAADVIDGGDAAEPSTVLTFVHSNFDLGLTRDVHSHDAVGLLPVRSPIVDQRENAEALDLVEVLTVDADGFASRDGTGAIVAGQFDERFDMEAAKVAAERLDAAFEAVVELEENSEVEIERLRTSEAGEKALLLRELVPVEIENDLPEA